MSAAVIGFAQDVAVFPQLGHSRAVKSVAFSSDMKYLVSTDKNTIKLWDVATKREIRSLTGHLNEVKSIAFSPDGKQVLSGSSDNTVKLWDAASGQVICTIELKWGVDSVIFSPDGKQILY